jgi:hypothetical protein
MPPSRSLLPLSPRTTAATFSPSPSSLSPSPRRDPLYTPSLRRAPHHARRDVHHTSNSESKGGGTQLWRRRRWRLEERDPATTTTTRTRRDPATRSMWGRGRGGEQAVTRSRDPSALTVWRSVANLGFEFMVCHSKNVLHNSVDAFYQLGNNCKINNNSVIR